MLKIMLLTAITAAVAVIAACGGAADTLTPEATAPAVSPTASPTEVARRPAVTIAAPLLRLELEGDGSDVFGPYQMGRGVIVIFARSEGNGPFSMTFVDEDQGLVKSVYSNPGPYRGERVHGVFDGNDGGLAPGTYMLDIEATGPWRLRIIQERVSTGQRPEIQMASSGDGGGSWIEFEDGE